MADTVNASIVEHFRTLEDPRIERTKKHLLLDILVIALCTLLTGGEGFQDMALFGKSKQAWLQTFLALQQHLDNLRRKDALRGAEAAEISVRLENYSASH